MRLNRDVRDSAKKPVEVMPSVFARMWPDGRIDFFAECWLRNKTGADLQIVRRDDDVFPRDGLGARPRLQVLVDREAGKHTQC